MNVRWAQIIQPAECMDEQSLLNEAKILRQTRLLYHEKISQGSKAKLSIIVIDVCWQIDCSRAYSSSNYFQILRYYFRLPID